jgi:hypothetical protein
MSIIDTPDWQQPGGQNGAATIGQPTPLIATVVAGSDGTDVWAVRTDSIGRIMPFGAQTSRGFGTAGGLNNIILEPAANGYNYLYGFDISLDVGGTPGLWYLYDDNSGLEIACGYIAAGSSNTRDLGGILQLDHLKLVYPDAACNYAIRYAIGPYP